MLIVGALGPQAQAAIPPAQAPQHPADALHASSTTTLAIDAEYEYRRHERLGSILNSVVERFERHRAAADRAVLERTPTQSRKAADAPAAQQAAAARRSATLAAAARAAANLAPMQLEGSEGLVAVTFHINDPATVDAVAAFVDEHGGSVRNHGEDYIEAYVPVAVLEAASQRPGVVRVRAIVPPELHRGSVVSQGVQIHKANTWHAAGYTGAGVKVGIIDGGFEGFSGLMGSELPSTIHARCYGSIGEATDNLSDCETETNHGTAVAESLLDIAPDVELYIGNYVTRADQQAASAWMVSQGVQVINASVGWTWDGPGDGTSPLSISALNTVDAAVRDGVLWVNSAGNAALQTWYGTFKDTNADGWHEFGNTTNRCNALVAPTRLIQLRWADSWPAATDLSIVALNESDGGVIDESGDPQSGRDGDVPYEQLVLRGSARVCLAVQRKSGPAPAWIQLQAFGGGRLATYTSHGSITNPAESANPGLLAVGAAPTTTPVPSRTSAAVDRHRTGA